jgi:hypothetical protein
MAQDQDIVPLKLLGDNSSQNGLIIWNEIILAFLFAGSFKICLLLKFIQNFQQSSYIVILNFGKRNIDETEGVQSFERTLFNQFKLDCQNVLFQFGFFVICDGFVIS